MAARVLNWVIALSFLAPVSGGRAGGAGDNDGNKEDSI
jgi:hypothetical protein